MGYETLFQTERKWCFSEGGLEPIFRAEVWKELIGNGTKNRKEHVSSYPRGLGFTNV